MFKGNLGHKNLQNTLRYVGAVDFDKQEFTVKVAETVEEATGLVEQGFQYVTEMDGAKNSERQNYDEATLRVHKHFCLKVHCFTFSAFHSFLQQKLE